MKTSTSSLSALLVFALAASVSAVVEESRHQQELREHYHHLSYIAEYSCHHPQARTVPVQELLSPYQTRGKAYFPEYTVLHRCDMFAGCCEGLKKCGPVYAESIHLPFKVTYLEDMGDKHKGEWEMEYGSFDNHTVCGCIDHNGSYKPEPHYAHEDKDHHKQEENDRKDHYSHEDHEHKYSQVASKDEYPPLVREPVRNGPSRTDGLESKLEKRPEPSSNNKKIDSLYITI